MASWHYESIIFCSIDYVPDQLLSMILLIFWYLRSQRTTYSKGKGPADPLKKQNWWSS